MAADDGHESGGYFEMPRGKLMLWGSVFAGPVAWFAHLCASYAVVLYACRGGGAWLLHVITALAAAVALAGAAVGWANWRRTREAGAGGARQGRTQLMSVAGMALSVYFLLVVLVAEAANLVYEPCGEYLGTQVGWARDDRLGDARGPTGRSIESALARAFA